MNIYSVLDSDDDEKPKQTKKVAAAPAAAAPAAAPAAPKGGKKPAAPAAAAVEFEVAPEAAKSSKPKTHTRHGEKKHGADAGEAPRRPRREKDRSESGTGRDKKVQKDGAGGSNWGNPHQDALEAEKTRATEDTVVEEPAVDAEPAAPEEPPAPVVFTLDEYNARRAAARASSEAFGEISVRAVSADFAGLKTKSEDNSDFMKLGSAKDKAVKKDQRSTQKTTVVDVAFTVAAPEPPKREERSGAGRGAGRGDRPRIGGRGDRAGGRGRGGDRPSTGRGAPRSNGARVDITDSNAFPSL